MSKSKKLFLIVLLVSAAVIMANKVVEAAEGLHVDVVGVADVSRVYDILTVVYDFVGVQFMVSSEKDIVITVNANAIYDNTGYEFNDVMEIWIGGQQTNRRRIIAGVPTSVWVIYRIDKGYGDRFASVFPRVSVNVSGQNCVFLDVPRIRF